MVGPFILGTPLALFANLAKIRSKIVKFAKSAKGVPLMAEEKRGRDEIDPLIPELKRVKEEHVDTHCPPRPILEDKDQLVKDLEAALKENIGTNKVLLFTRKSDYIVPSVHFTNPWWVRVCEWAYGIVDNPAFPHKLYGNLFKEELNDCIDDIEAAWILAHPTIGMNIDADAYYPEKGTFCAVFNWEEEEEPSA